MIDDDNDDDDVDVDVDDDDDDNDNDDGDDDYQGWAHCLCSHPLPGSKCWGLNESRGIIFAILIIFVKYNLSVTKSTISIRVFLKIKNDLESG